MIDSECKPEQLDECTCDIPGLPGKTLIIMSRVDPMKDRLDSKINAVTDVTQREGDFSIRCLHQVQ